MATDYASFALTLSDMQDSMYRTIAAFELVAERLEVDDDAYSSRDEAARLGFNFASITANLISTIHRSSLLDDLPMGRDWRAELDAATAEALRIDDHATETAADAVSRRAKALREAAVLLYEMRTAWSQAALADEHLLSDTDYQALLGS